MLYNRSLLVIYFIYFLIFISVLIGLHLCCCEGFSPVSVSGGYSSCSARASRCGGLSLQSTSSRARGLQ